MGMEKRSMRLMLIVILGLEWVITTSQTPLLKYNIENQLKVNTGHKHMEPHLCKVFR